jgi:hypothetical protein
VPGFFFVRETLWRAGPLGASAAPPIICHSASAVGAITALCRWNRTSIGTRQPATATGTSARLASSASTTDSGNHATGQRHRLQQERVVRGEDGGELQEARGT